MAVVLAIGLGVGVAIAELPATPGDLLSFAGSLIGAAVAVMGAIYVFEHQRQETTAEARRVLRELLEDVLSKIETVRKPEPTPGYEPALVALTNAGFLREAIDAVKQARQWHTPATAGMVRAYAQIEMLSIDESRIRDDLRPQKFYGGLPDMGQYVDMLETRTRVALTQLNL